MCSFNRTWKICSKAAYREGILLYLIHIQNALRTAFRKIRFVYRCTFSKIQVKIRPAMRCSWRQAKIGLCDQGPHENTVYGVITITYIPTLLGQFLFITFNLRNTVSEQQHIHRQYSFFCLSFFKPAFLWLALYSGGPLLESLCRAQTNFNDVLGLFLVTSHLLWMVPPPMPRPLLFICL